MIYFDRKPESSPKDEALKLLPKGTKCVKTSRYGRSLHAVVLPDGRQISEESLARSAWRSALEWAESQNA